MNDAYKTSLSITTTGATPATGILQCAVGRKRGGGVQLTGTFTGTVLFEETLDSGTTWIAKTVYPAAGGPGVTSATGTGQWKFACGGSTNFRIRCSAFTSGPIGAAITLTDGVDAVALSGGGSAAPIGGGITWQAVQTVAMTGSSKTFVPANAARKALQMWSPATNAAGAIDLAGGTVTLAGNIPLFAGAAPIYIDGPATPVGIVTAIGTSGQNFYYQEGL